jgi:hypothetical protein
MTYKSISTIIFCGLLIRLLLAYVNAFIGPTPGGENDALGFHFVGSHYAITGDPLAHDIYRVGWYYSLFLGYVYKYSINSIFLGSLFSILAWFLSTLLVLRIMELINASIFQKVCSVSLMSFLTSMIFYSSVTLREPFQLFFLTLLVYSILRFALTKSLLHLFLLPLALFGLALLHQSLIVTSILLLLLFTIYLYSKGIKKIWQNFGLYMIFLLMIGLVPVASSLIQTLSYSFEAGIVESLISHNEGLIGDAGQARARYRIEPPENSFFGIFTYPFIAFFQYQLEPLPWNVSGFGDILLFLENLIRVKILFYLIKFAYKEGLFSVDYIFPLLISYLIVEGIWSLGTINWGTASRHHIPAMGLLSVLGFFLYSEIEKKFVKKIPS